jgi:hypothetical protein
LLCLSRGGAPGGGAVVLDVAQLEALLTRTFSIELDVGRGREKVALVRLRLTKALLGGAETQAMAAEAPTLTRRAGSRSAWRRAAPRSPSRTWSATAPTCDLT